MGEGEGSCDVPSGSSRPEMPTSAWEQRAFSPLASWSPVPVPTCALVAAGHRLSKPPTCLPSSRFSNLGGRERWGKAALLPSNFLATMPFKKRCMPPAFFALSARKLAAMQGRGSRGSYARSPARTREGCPRPGRGSGFTGPHGPEGRAGGIRAAAARKGSWRWATRSTSKARGPLLGL